jgi:hypothetical protein
MKTWLSLNPNGPEHTAVSDAFLLNTSISSLKEIAQYVLTY